MDQEEGWNEIFFKENFSVDEYLSKYTQKSDLLLLRNGLKKYGVELYNCMVNILKSETEAIVTLAENLANLNVSINSLSQPISQLVEEIRTLYNVIDNSKQLLRKKLDKIDKVGDTCNQLNLKSGILLSSEYVDSIILSNGEKVLTDISILERFVGQYSFLKLHLDEMNITSAELEVVAKATSNKLDTVITAVFLKAIADHEHDVIEKCLRMYADLNRYSEAETVYRNNIIQPLLAPIFTQKNLEEHSQDLDKIFEEATEILNGNMSLILNILTQNPDIKGFNFIVNSFWCEADQLLHCNLPNIVAPGNPELFHKRFCTTFKFLKTISEKSNNPNLLQEKSFISHVKRFNLAVYFEIRFQQIAGQFETELLADIEKRGEKLNSTVALQNALKECFNKDVFLVHLADQFVKLAALLISRYVESFDDSYLLQIFALKQMYLTDALTDLIFINNLLTVTDFETSMFAIIPLEIRELFQNSLKISRDYLMDKYNELQKQLVTLKIEESATSLQEVKSIPRLFRRTNRNAPTKRSNYIKHALRPILIFHETYKPILNDRIDDLMDLMVGGIAQRYSDLMIMVIHSMCRTEESLRRLKSRNVNSAEEGVSPVSGEAISDEVKIKDQIKLDVTYFVKQMKPFAGESSLKVMKNLAEEAGCENY